MDFESVGGVLEVGWKKILSKIYNTQKGRIINHRLTIPYHQLEGSELYEISEYSDAPGTFPDRTTTGVISVLERSQCNQGCFYADDICLFLITFR